MNAAPPPGSLRPATADRAAAGGTVARALAAGQDRQHPAGQGGDPGAGRAGLRGRPRDLHHSGARRRRSACSLASASAWCWPISRRVLLLGAVLAGRLTRVWVERRRGSAGSRLHVRLVLLFGGVAVAPAIVVACFRRRLLPFRHPGLVQRSGAQAVTESLQVVARLSGGASQQHPRGRAGDGQRPDARRPVPRRRSHRSFAEVLGTQTDAARADRGGDLRAAHRPGAGRGRLVRRHGRRAAVPDL